MVREALVLVGAFAAVTNSMGLVLGPARCLGYGSRGPLLALSALGWVLGYLVEGPNFRLPSVGLPWVYAVPPALLAALTLAGYPTSITQLYVASLLGYSLARGYGSGLGAVAWIASSWALSLAAGLALSVPIRAALARAVGSLGVGSALLVVRACSLVYVFLLSYVLGGNVLGTVASLLGAERDPVALLLVSAAAAASVYASSRSRVALGLARVLFPTGYLSSLVPYSVSIVLTQLANRAGVPIVTSLVMFSSTLGVGLASEFRFLHGRRVLAYLATSYAGSFSLALLASYLISALLPG